MGECLIIRAGGGTDTSNATATANTVLSGYSCYANDELVIGAITPQSTNAELNPGEECAIPEGYHDGTGVISATTLSSQTSGTANASRILSGRTAWVNGNQITGSMTNRGAVNQNLSANGSYTIPSGWHSGSGKVTQSLTTQGAKSVTPTTSNQTACAANRWTTGTIVILGSGNLVSGNIKNGVTIFGVKGNFTGWVDSQLLVLSNGGVQGGYGSYQIVDYTSGDGEGYRFNPNSNVGRGWNWFKCTATIRWRSDESHAHINIEYTDGTDGGTNDKWASNDSAYESFETFECSLNSSKTISYALLYTWDSRRAGIGAYNVSMWFMNK